MNGSGPELRGALFLNAAALLLTVLTMTELHQLLQWWVPPLVLHGYLPMALAAYVIALLLSYLALNQALTARRAKGETLTSVVAIAWSCCNALLVVFGAVKVLMGLRLGL